MRTSVVARASAASLAAFLALPAAASENVYTIAKYPVEAIAKDAVTAKRQAVSDAQRRALRSLWKRLIPVTRYKQIEQLNAVTASDLLDGVQIRSEQNSRTEYIAELDIRFRPDAVRSTLRQAGVPFVDKQAPITTLVPVYFPPQMVNGPVPKGFNATSGSRLWRRIWSDLDLENALSPLKLRELIRQIHPDTLRMVLAGEGGGQRILTGEYGMPRVIIAALQPDFSTKRMVLKLAGADAVGQFRLERQFRFAAGEEAYAMELAAVVAHGIIEGRWKHETAGPAAQSVQISATGGAQPIAVSVAFVSLAQWQQLRQVIETTPGVTGIDVQGLTSRSAQLNVMYPPGGQALSDALARRGLRLVPDGNGWFLQ